MSPFRRVMSRRHVTARRQTTSREMRFEFAVAAFIVSLRLCFENLHVWLWKRPSTLAGLRVLDTRSLKGALEDFPKELTDQLIALGGGSLRQSVDPADLKPYQSISPEE